MLLSKIMQYTLSIGSWFEKENKIGGPASNSSNIMDSIQFAQYWDVLGPWSIGTREATWGADPTYRHGGFSKMIPEADIVFPSSIVRDGLVGWTKSPVSKQKTDANAVEVDLEFSFPEVDWDTFQGVSGWPALQWQAWARTEIQVIADEALPVRICTDGILEFVLDSVQYFGGDFYSIRRAPLFQVLEPGIHVLEIRLLRDTRAHGAVIPPTIVGAIRLEVVTDLVSVSEQHTIAPDWIEGEGLSSKFASVLLRNDGFEDAKVLDVSCNLPYAIRFAFAEHSVLKPGQTRPIALVLEIASRPYRISHMSCTFEVSTGPGKSTLRVPFDVEFVPRKIDEFHKITYLVSGNTVSFSQLLPPKLGTGGNSSETLPVLLNMHGSGVDVNSDQARHQLDHVWGIQAWTILPSGTGPWTGDDWHGVGFGDVIRALDAIPTYIRDHAWAGPGVDINKWIVSGHSNGGQGTWFALSHYAEHIAAAAPVAGYSSIQAYVPYSFWTEADPALEAVLQGSLLPYRNELFTENYKDIPIFIQHGGSDTNVPVRHARRMYELLENKPPKATFYEISGKDHWFEGIMETDYMRMFYDKIHQFDRRSGVTRQTAVAAGLGASSSAGLCILTVGSAGRLSRADFEFEKSTRRASITTTNVRQLRLMVDRLGIRKLSAIEIDGDRLSLDLTRKDGDLSLVRVGSHWEARDQRHETEVTNWRSLQQQGSMAAVTNTQGSLRIIRDQDPTASRIALQVSRNMLQYFAMDSDISSTGGEPRATSDSNSIVITTSITELQQHLKERQHFPMQVSGRALSIRAANGDVHRYEPRPGLGLVLIYPDGQHRTKLLVWGADDAGLESAARFVPAMTGVGQPDFLLVEASHRLRGLGGVVAAGFFDYEWKLTTGSYLR